MMRRLCVAYLAVLAAAFFAIPAASFAATQVGTFATVSGDVTAGQKGQELRRVEAGSAILLHDMVATAADSRCSLVFNDDSVLKLDQNTSIQIDEAVFDPESKQQDSKVQLLQGRLRAFVSRLNTDNGRSYEILTANGIAGVRGTEFIVTYERDGDLTQILTLEGTVGAANRRVPNAESIQLQANQLTVIQGNRPPSPPRRLGNDDRRLFLRGLELYDSGPSAGQANRQLATKPFALGPAPTPGTGPANTADPKPQPEQAPSKLQLKGLTGGSSPTAPPPTPNAQSVGDLLRSPTKGPTINGPR